MRKNNDIFQVLSIVGLLLTFLCGRFSLSNWNIAYFQIRYAIVMLSLIFLIALLNRNPNFVKYSQAIKVFFLTFFMFTLYSAISMFWLKNITIGISKFIDVIFLLFMLLILLITIHTFKNRDKLAVILAYFFILIGFVYSSTVFYQVFIRGFSRGGVYIGGYNVQTRILFMSISSCIFLFTLKNKSSYIFFICFFLMAIFLLMSKQGIVTSILVLMLFFSIKMFNYFKNIIYKEKKILIMADIKRIFKILAIISVSFLLFHDRIYYILKYTNKYLKEFFWVNILKVDNLTLIAEVAEKSARARLFVNSINAIKEHPFWGIGLGGYLDVPSIGFYPHNIALEFLLDGGILGGIFFLIFASYSIYTILKARKSIYLPFCLIPLYMLIVSFISGGLYDFRYYFMWVIISLYLISGRYQSR